MSALQLSSCFVDDSTRTFGLADRNRELVNLMKTKRMMIRNQVAEMAPQEVIEAALKGRDASKVSLGWSGGRCSTVVLHMALKIDPNISVVYHNTGVEFPENVKYVRKLVSAWQIENFTMTHPEITFWQILEKFHEWPTPRIMGMDIKNSKNPEMKKRRRQPLCCRFLKEFPRFKYYKEHNIQCDICGLRCAESRVRSFHIGKRGQLYDIQKPEITTAAPIALWTERDVRFYFKSNNILANDVYLTQGRNGCWPCPAYKKWTKNVYRWSPQAYRFIMKMRRETKKRWLGAGPLDKWLIVPPEVAKWFPDGFPTEDVLEATF